VYDFAKAKGFRTIGLVSTNLDAKDVSENCDEVCFIETPEDSWDVLDSDGKSLMVKLSDEMIYFGGGQTSWNEIQEAMTSGVKVKIFTDFSPKMSEEEFKKRAIVVQKLKGE
jgi:predicted Rossmann-fold nucleotide-binding protein